MHPYLNPNNPEDFFIPPQIANDIREYSPGAEFIEGPEGLEICQNIEKEYLAHVAGMVDNMLSIFAHDNFSEADANYIIECLEQKKPEKIRVIPVRNLRAKGLWHPRHPHILFVDYDSYEFSKTSTPVKVDFLSTLAHEYTHLLHLAEINERGFSEAYVQTPQGLQSTLWTEVIARYMDTLVAEQLLTAYATSRESRFATIQLINENLIKETEEFPELQLRELLITLLRDKGSDESRILNLAILQSISGVNFDVTIESAIDARSSYIINKANRFNNFDLAEAARYAQGLIEDLKNCLTMPLDYATANYYLQKHRGFREFMAREIRRGG